MANPHRGTRNNILCVKSDINFVGTYTGWQDFYRFAGLTNQRTSMLISKCVKNVVLNSCSLLLLLFCKSQAGVSRNLVRAELFALSLFPLSPAELGAFL